jgi:hypothetical protein
MKVLCSFLLLSICIAQAPTPKPWKARVTATLSKASFKPGESIKVRLQLENTGTNSFYISKHFGPSGGGIAGFYTLIEDASGKPAHTCGFGGDVWPSDARPAEQILKESYLLLIPGQSVGYTQEMVCPPVKPGAYTITTYYSPQDFWQKRVENIANRDSPVLDAAVDGPKLTFNIVSSKEKARPKPRSRN